MSHTRQKALIMPPQISPKDVPQEMSESDSDDETTVANIVQETSSSEDEDVELMDEILQGYVPLSMHDDSEAFEDSSQVPEVLPNNTERHEAEESAEDSANNTSSSSSSVSGDDSTHEPSMDSDQVNLIQNVMSNISLPTSSIPEWAKLVPEDKWKTSLLTSLECRTSTQTKEANPFK